MDTKKLTFAIMMGALGSAIFSFLQIPIAPGVALDFSLLVVFIVGIYAGPKAGLLTGLLAGLAPGLVLGPLSPTGSILALIAIPLGKALTGVTVGLLASHLNLKNNLLGIPLTLLAYIPEGLFTVTYFKLLLPLFFNSSIANSILYIIMTKAIGEIAIISLIIAVLLGNKAVSNFIEVHFCQTTKLTPI